MKKRIIIVGGGAGGIMAANRLRKAIPSSRADVVVIEKNSRHYYQPGFLTLLFDIDRAEDLVRDVKELLMVGIELITDEATAIGEGVIETADSGTVTYDYLVLATGAKLFFDEPEGLREALEADKNAFTFYELEEALKLRKALKEFAGGTIVSCISELPIKCPAAPSEFILLAEAEMRRRKIRDKSRFVLTVPSAYVPPSVEPYGSTLENILLARGIEIVRDFIPATVDGEGAVCTDMLGREIGFDLLAVVPSHGGEDIINTSSGLGDPSGWVLCNRTTLEHKGFDNISVVGDAANFPAGKTASAARKQAHVLAGRIASHILGIVPREEYDGTTICPILTDFGKAFFAEFNYEKSISDPRDTFAKWYLHVHLLKRLYWHYILPGRFFG